MMSLSNTTGHAIRALSCLASCENPPASIKDVAESSGVPPAYLAKIVKKLNDSGIVSSKRGNKGGIWLARPARLVSLLDIEPVTYDPADCPLCREGLKLVHPGSK